MEQGSEEGVAVGEKWVAKEPFGRWL